MKHPQQQECLQRFQSDGFVALPKFVDGSQLDELLANVQRFLTHVVPQLPAQHVFFEDKNDAASLKQIQQMGDHDPWFNELLTASPFRDTAELFLNGPVVPKNMQYFDKPPGIGRPTPPHQDGYYFMLTPCEAVTMWFALDHADQENGCVHYIEGSHQLGMREHSRTETLGFSQGIVGFPTKADRQHEIAIPAAPGDLLIHDAMTIHRADANHSQTRSRAALGFIYYSERALEDKDAHVKYQRKLAEDLKADGKI